MHSALPICPVWLLLLWQTKHRKPAWGEKGSFHLPSYSQSLREAKAGNQDRTLAKTWREDQTQSPWGKCRLLLALQSLLGFFIQPWTICPGGTVYSGLGPCTAIVSQEHTPRLAYRPVWCGIFFPWDSLFPNDLSLWQIDKKFTSPPSYFHFFIRGQNNESSLRKCLDFFVCLLFNTCVLA